MNFETVDYGMGEIRVERTVDGRSGIRIRYTGASRCNRRLNEKDSSALCR